MRPADSSQGTTTSTGQHFPIRNETLAGKKPAHKLNGRENVKFADIKE
jgi:hypothetical protein